MYHMGLRHFLDDIKTHNESDYEKRWSFVSGYSSIYTKLSVCLSIYLYLSLSIPIYLSRSIYLSLFISIYLSINIYLSIYHYLSITICLSINIYLSIYLSFACLSIVQQAGVCLSSCLGSVKWARPSHYVTLR